MRIGPHATPWARAADDRLESAAAEECGLLRWIGSDIAYSSGHLSPPAPGTCDVKGAYEPDVRQPKVDRDQFKSEGSIRVVFYVQGDIYSTIPISNDHLDIEHSQTINRIVLTPIAAHR